MLKLVLAFAACFGSNRRRGGPNDSRPPSDWPVRPHRPQGDDKVLTEARRALDGVNHPLIL